MTAATEGVIVTEPGVYDGLPEDFYHADPVPNGSLSVSGAKRLLPPSCPAIFAWEREHGRPDRRVFDFGHAAHKKVLGVGADIVVVQRTAKDGSQSDAEDYKSKSAQEHREEIRAAGKVPLLASEVAQVDAMAARLYEHPVAQTLLNPDFGRPEQSAFWPDPATGVWRRARFDWLSEPVDGQLIVSDYKTADSANPDQFERVLARLDYAMQASWYVDAAIDLGLADVAEFLFIVQEKTPPYLVSIVQPDLLAMRTGSDRCRRAIDIYAECSAADHWPGYTDEVALVSVPQWYVRANEEDQ